MSRGGDIGPLLWGDAEYSFRLGIGELRKVQERCDSGPAEIATRLYAIATTVKNKGTVEQAVAFGMGGAWKVDDVREVILRGLVGGGMTEHDAAKVVRERLDEQMDFKRGAPLAYAIIMAAISGPEDEPLGEEKAGTEKPKRRSRATKSGSETYTKSAEQ